MDVFRYILRCIELIESLIFPDRVMRAHKKTSLEVGSVCGWGNPIGLSHLFEQVFDLLEAGLVALAIEEGLGLFEDGLGFGDAIAAA